MSSVGIAREYRDLCDTLVLDTQDEQLAESVAAENVAPAVLQTIMLTDQDKINLARGVLELSQTTERTGC